MIEGCGKSLHGSVDVVIDAALTTEKVSANMSADAVEANRISRSLRDLNSE